MKAHLRLGTPATAGGSGFLNMSAPAGEAPLEPFFGAATLRPLLGAPAASARSAFSKPHEERMPGRVAALAAQQAGSCTQVHMNLNWIHVNWIRVRPTCGALVRSARHKGCSLDGRCAERRVGLAFVRVVHCARSWELSWLVCGCRTLRRTRFRAAP